MQSRDPKKDKVIEPGYWGNFAAALPRTLIAHPFDTVAKKLQIPFTIDVNGNPVYPKFRDLSKDVQSNFGKPGLANKYKAVYPGFGITCIYKGAQIAILDNVKKLKSDAKDKILTYTPIQNPALASGLAIGAVGVGQTLLLQPLAFAKTRVQTNHANISLKSAKEIKDQPHKGVGRSCGRNIGYLFVANETGEIVDKYLTEKLRDKDGNPIFKEDTIHAASTIVGANAGIVATIPIDRSKTATQTYNVNSKMKLGKFKEGCKEFKKAYKEGRMFSNAKSILQKELPILARSAVVYSVGETAGLIGYFGTKNAINRKVVEIKKELPEFHFHHDDTREVPSPF